MSSVDPEVVIDELRATVRHLLEALEEDSEYWSQEQITRYLAWIEQAKALVEQHDEAES